MKDSALGKKRVVLFTESPFVDCNRRMAIGMLNDPGMGRDRYLSIIRPPETARKMKALLDRARGPTPWLRSISRANVSMS